MVNPLTYQRFSDDVFMLLCRADTPVQDMPDHPVIAELAERLDETRQVSESTGLPFGPLTKPRSWRGTFAVGTCLFNVPSMYVFPKFFGLVCDTLSGTHSSTEIEGFVNEVNAAVAADLGVEKLG